MTSQLNFQKFDDAWLNNLLLDSNDAYDAETGVDKGKKESVVNMTGRYQNMTLFSLYWYVYAFTCSINLLNDMVTLCSQKGVLISAYICLVFGIMGLLWGAWQAHNMLIFALLAGAIGCGYIYQVC
jgi:1,4-dihydroxy-2-naphthoate octaprenyltransferase